MSLIVELPPDVERSLRERAAAEGQDVTAFVRGLIDRELRFSALRGSVTHFDDPFGPATAPDDWEAA